MTRKDKIQHVQVQLRSITDKIGGVNCDNAAEVRDCLFSLANAVEELATCLKLTSDSVQMVWAEMPE